MISEARREASRTDGRRGRGPNTPARSSRNDVRHGLTRPGGRDPAFTQRIAELARLIAGPQVSGDLFVLACRITSAQIDVERARRGRTALLCVNSPELETVTRLVAVDRYLGRAMSRRNRAIWHFCTARAGASHSDDQECAAPAVLAEIALGRRGTGAQARVSSTRRRALPRYQRPLPRLSYAYAAAMKRHAAAHPRYWLLAPARFLLFWPNEPKALRCTQDVAARPTRRGANPLARPSPNEPEPFCRAPHDPAERTQAGAARCVRSRPNEPEPFQPQHHNVAERTRGGGIRRAWFGPNEPEEFE
jgi:hypothetical protein